MDTGVSLLILICIVVLAIAALVALLTKSGKDNSHRTDRRLLLTPPLFGATNPRKSGIWYTTNFFTGEKVNEAIREGQERYAHKHPPAHHRQKRSR